MALEMVFMCHVTLLWSLAQLMGLEELLSTSSERRKNLIPSRMVWNSANFESSMSIWLESVPFMKPWSSLRTPPIPAGPGFPLTAPSVFSLGEPRGGGIQ